MSLPMRGRRLLLRPLEDKDSAALFAAVAASREALRRRLRWATAVASLEHCRGFIRASARARARGQRQDFGVFETRAGELAGVASLQAMLAAPGLAEVSGWIRADRQGRGLAVEAGRLLVAHAFKSALQQKLYARLDPANRAARRVVQDLGFRYEGCLRREKRLHSRWIDQECWGLLQAEWRSK